MPDAELGFALIVSGVAFVVGTVLASASGAPDLDYSALVAVAGGLFGLGLVVCLLRLLPARQRWMRCDTREQRRRQSTESPRMPEPDPTPVLTALIKMTEVQLAEAWAVARDQNTYALALAGLGVAVMGIVVAAQNALGADWWVPIPGLAVTTLVALLGTTRRGSDLGPEAASFYAAFGAAPSEDALAQLLADLIKTLHQVPETLRAQRQGLLVVFGLFATTAIYSTLLLA
jgi:hypothetical protein